MTGTVQSGVASGRAWHDNTIHLGYSPETISARTFSSSDAIPLLSVDTGI